MKQWVRQRALSRLQTLRGTKVKAPTRTAKTTSGLMASALDCFEAWCAEFETDEWRAKAVKEKKSVGAFYFHWAGPKDIVRPEVARYDVLDGITSSYQFFMLRQGAALMRRHSCWCPACFAAAMAGTGEGTRLTSEYLVPGCVHIGKEDAGLYEWRNASCRAREGGEVCGPDKRARTRGHELAAQGMQPGEWVLVECFGDEEGEMWLGKTMAFPDFGGKGMEKHVGGQATEFNVAFNTGDCKVAVQWYERLPDGDKDGANERREFRMGKPAVDVINSTELRARGFSMDLISTGPPRRLRGAARAACAADAEGYRQWRLPLSVEGEALTWCR